MHSVARIIFVMALCLSFSKTSFGLEDHWPELNSRFLRLLKNSQYVEASGVADRALKVAEKSFGPDDPRTATSLNNMAELFRIQGKYLEAESMEPPAKVTINDELVLSVGPS